MRPFWGVIAWLPLWLLTACVASQIEAPTAGSDRVAYDRILTSGDIQIAEAHLTAQTQAAVRAYQRRYGLSVSGLLDRETRLELVPGLDPVPKH